MFAAPLKGSVVQRPSMPQADAGHTTYSDFFAGLNGLDGSPVQFATDVLAIQCLLGQAEAGAVLQGNAEQDPSPLACYPPSACTNGVPRWLAQASQAAPRAIETGRSLALPISPEDNRRQASQLLVIPVSLASRMAEAFVVSTEDKARFERSRQILETTALMLALSEKRLEHRENRAGIEKLHRSLTVLSATNEHQRFRATAMAFCNEIAAQWGCERACLGFLGGRYVRLTVMSHTEHFARKMKLIQDIEAAMEECLDQDSEIVLPAAPDATYISRVSSELARQHGPASMLSLPLRHDGKVPAVLLLQRPADQPFQMVEIESIRLTCDLCTPRLVNLHEHDRWIGARIATRTRKALAVLLGAEHTWAKLSTVGIFALIVFLAFAQGTYKAEASFVLEATEQHTLCAPFDGFLKDVQVEVGDAIEQNHTVLAELDTAELRLQLAAAAAEQAGYLKEMAAAMRDSETAKAQIAQANADKAQAQIELNEYFIEHAKILAPASGTVVTGDLKRQIGAPVKTGDALFEVAPLESLRAELRVPEDQIFDVAVDQHGYLATVSYPSRRIEFVVERIDPAAELIQNRNVFTVRARLLDIQPWMRPGMEGVAKVTIGKRHYVWIWSRKLVNWIRMKLWI